MSVPLVGTPLAAQQVAFGQNAESCAHAEVQGMANAAMSSINQMYRDCLGGAMADCVACFDTGNRMHTLCLLYYAGAVVGVGVAALVALS